MSGVGPHYRGAPPGSRLALDTPSRPAGQMRRAQETTTVVACHLGVTSGANRPELTKLRTDVTAQRTPAPIAARDTTYTSCWQYTMPITRALATTHRAIIPPTPTTVIPTAATCNDPWPRGGRLLGPGTGLPPPPLRALRAHLVTKGQWLLAIHRGNVGGALRGRT